MPKKVETISVKATEDKSEVVNKLRECGSTVYYEKSITKNLGNYESTKLTVGVTLPIKPTKEEMELIKLTIEKADEAVTDELIKQLEDICTEAK